FSYPAFNTLRKLPQFSDLVAFAPNQFTISARGTSDLAFGDYVSSNYFTGLGAQPLLGRPILPGDSAVAVLTYRYWSRRFAADPNIVGRVIAINRVPVTVIGVMRPSFQGLMPGLATGLFVPMSMVPETAASYYSLTKPDFWWIQIFGRLKPGVSNETAATAVRAAFVHEIESYTGKKLPPSSQPKIALQPGGRGVGLLRDRIGTEIYILAAVAVIVLLIACANLASLLLARYSARAREIVVRISIGAGRFRLVRQMLTESMLLAAIGAAVGLLIAKPMLHLLVNFFSGTSFFKNVIDAQLDSSTLAFAVVVAIVTALLFGLVPAWRATRVNLAPELKDTAVATSGRRPGLLLGRYLVPVQIALSLLLMVGAGLFLRTLVNLASVNLGFQTDHLLTFQTDPGKSGYKPAQESTLYRRLERQIAAIPGVQDIGISQLPLIGGVATNGPVRLPGDIKGKETYFLYCSNSFLSTMRIPIVLGRDLSPADFDRPMRSAVVNETFVKKYLPHTNPIGQIFYPPDANGHNAQPVTIVGVARDAHYRSVRQRVPPTAYEPYPLRFSGDTNMVFVIRTSLAPLSIASAVRKAVAHVDTNLPVADMRTEREQIDRSLGTETMFASLVAIFGSIALILAAIGLYGVVAFSVARRTQEIGIRMALGARRGNVLWLVLRQSLFMAAAGIAVGVPCALALTKLVGTLLYGVKPNDPISIAAAVAAMVAVATLASWIPARRAARVDPMTALRYE
ncbi:MAG TPA: ABC transporter permease, partial [Bryobacteraceae bacterium]